MNFLMIKPSPTEKSELATTAFAGGDDDIGMGVSVAAQEHSNRLPASAIPFVV